MAESLTLTTPVGRIVGGSIYEPNTTDAEGKQLVYKTGPDQGKPRVDYYIAVAVPKGAEKHWAETTWGAKIWQFGHQAFPNVAQSPTFAWKITDGDSQIPNRKGRKPCDQEGHKGHWILKFSGSYAPAVFVQENGAFQQVTTPGYVKPGYYIEMQFNVKSNGSAQQPGLYLNHIQLCFRGYGPEITFGPDVASAGFGAAPLPAGASMTPPPSAAPMPMSTVPAVPGVPAIPAAPPVPGIPAAPMVPAGVPVPTAPTAPPLPVTPNPQFAGIPAVPGVPVPSVPAAPPAPPPAAPVRQMTALATAPYETYIQSGWTDALLIAHGYMTP